MITSLEIRNLLSFGEGGISLPLGPLSVLIGSNGSGKSNLVDVISLLQGCPRDIGGPIRASGGIRDWKHRSADNANVIPEITATVRVRRPSVETIKHNVALDDGFGGDPEVRAESVWIENNEKLELTFKYEGYGATIFPRKHRVGIARPNSLEEPQEVSEYEFDKSVVAQLRGNEHMREARILAREYEGIRIYRNWSFGRQDVARLAQPTDQKNDFLAEDGSNLGLVLNRLRNDPSSKRKILTEVRNLMSGISEFDVLVQAGTVQLFLEEFEQSIPATRLSDGTLRYLSLLAILCNPTPLSLVCIEEPELGLHPDVIPSLARLLIEASERTQLIVTTHSDAIIDALSERPEVVVVCERDEEGSKMQRLEPKQLAQWLQKYKLGELWSKGELGGNRW